MGGGEWINFLETQHVGNTGMGSGWGQGRHMLGIVTVHCYQLQMGRGEHCFGIESSLKLRVFIISICGERNKLNSLQEISDVVSHRNFQQRLMHYENSSTLFPLFLSQMSLFSDSFTAFTGHNCRGRWRKNPNCHHNSGLGCESSFNRQSDCL